MSLAALLSRWRSEPDTGPNVMEWRTLPARLAQFVPFPAELHPLLADSLQRRGIRALYSHQARSWEHARAGEHVVVVTGTASGKTLCYNLPVLDHLLQMPQARALYLLPTRALAQDQLAGLKSLVTGFPKGGGQWAAIYDGDTPSNTRPAIRKNARLVLSNPDMLHLGILPHHTAWAEFLSGLQYVVMDEMHTYRGVFGSHVANVIRRLKRVAHFYGASPQFILTSATIANPAELAGLLIEERAALIEEDGSARGRKHFLIYNPPVVDNSIGLRRGLLQETSRLAQDLLDYQVQSLVFGRSRRMVEMLLSELRERSTLADAQYIRGYRSGYLPRQRREIEQGLRSGEIRLVVATNALELGIDIGGMDASLMAGFPGTIAAAWQQAGRAGRGEADSLSVLVTGADPLDQFLANHPDYFFERSPEQALINPDNLLILLGHIRCAAFELPFRDGEAFGRVDAPRLSEFLGFLEESGLLHRSGDKYFWTADQYPAQGISLRSASANTVLLHTPAEGGGSDAPLETIGEVDRASAPWMVHPGAVYLHEASAYLVKELDLEHGKAILLPFPSDYYTEPQRETSVQLASPEALPKFEHVLGGRKYYGELLVTTQVVGYRQIRWHTRETLGMGEVNLPPSELLTMGYWLALGQDTVDELAARRLWSAAPNQYGPGWDALRERVRKRDGYRCQVCGLPETGRSHHVHHKIPFRAFLSVEQANQMQNLITLCPACHRRAETVVRIRSGLSGLAFVLGHLAPLFLMCDTGDLGVHADPQCLLAEGQPSVVLYDLAPAGIGLSERLFEIHAELMLRALELVQACGCADGCPSCVGPGGAIAAPVQGGELALPGGKREALALLEILSA